MEELDILIQDLYESNMLGKLPDRQYQRLMNQYDSEQTALEQRKAELENAMNTIRRLLMAEKVTVDPAIRKTVHGLVSDIAHMAICSPQKYGQYLADSRSIDEAYTMDGDKAVIQQK